MGCRRTGVFVLPCIGKMGAVPAGASAGRELRSCEREWENLRRCNQKESSA